MFSAIEVVYPNGYPHLPRLLRYFLAAVTVPAHEASQQVNGVSMSVWRRELTVAEAAELLNVSRPFVIKLLESGAMPFRKVGTRRRVRLVDVLEYRDRQDAIANAALDNMVRQAEEHGLYD